MKISVRRFEYGDTYTISRLYVQGSWECFGLEDKVRPEGEKIHGKTAIPAGVYRVVIDFSPRFNRRMLHILNVPGFEGVRIHTGNKDEETEGCILVGKDWSGGGWIGSSRAAYLHLMNKVSEALDDKDFVTIEIIDTK